MNRGGTLRRQSPGGKQFIQKLGQEGEREEEWELVEGVDTRDKFQGQNNSSTVEAVEVEVYVQVDTLVQGGLGRVGRLKLLGLGGWEVETVGEKSSPTMDRLVLIPVHV